MIVNTVENMEGHNYQQITTSGVEWGVDAKIGLHAIWPAAIWRTMRNKLKFRLEKL